MNSDPFFPFLLLSAGFAVAVFVVGAFIDHMRRRAEADAAAEEQAAANRGD
jgi:hypothetical protein